MPKPSPTQLQRAPRRRSWWRWLALSSTCLTVLFAGGVLLGVSCRPAWYRPAAVDSARLPEDKRDLVRLVDQIGAALNRGEAVTIEILPAQLNRWLAARRELADVLPLLDAPELEQLENPHISFEAGGMRIGWTATQRAIRAVASCVVRPTLSENNLSLGFESFHVGRVPIPGRLLDEALRRVLPAEDAGLLQPGPALQFSNRFEWVNGRREWRFEAIDVTKERLRLTIRPAR